MPRKRRQMVTLGIFAIGAAIFGSAAISSGISIFLTAYLIIGVAVMSLAVTISVIIIREEG